MKFVRFTANFSFGHEDRDESFVPGKEPVKVTDDCTETAIAAGAAEFVSDADGEAED